jgi:DNA-binding GntR family transcriptional regulator
MPVRDALRQLRHEGLLEEDRGNHLRIASFDFESIRDVYAVKAAAHARATRRATERSTDAELASLLDIHREMVRAVDQGDSADVAVSNWSFHRRINVLARAPYLVATLRALPIRFDGSAFHADVGWTHQCIQEHQEVMQAITDRGADLAAQLMNEHVTHSAEFMISWLSSVRLQNSSSTLDDEVRHSSEFRAPLSGSAEIT